MTTKNYIYHAPRQTGKVPIKSWTKNVQIEYSALEQLHNTTQLPFIHKHLAVMPDVHWGMGATVGSVIPTKGAIIPAAVGVDIGCGMVAVRTNVRADQLPDNLHAMRMAIEAVVPVGQAAHKESMMGLKHIKLGNGITKLMMIDKDLQKLDMKKFSTQLGSLGGGNHFIEISIDESDCVWIVLHSGSRGTGNIVGSHYIQKAKKEMERHFIQLPDHNLAYLVEGSEHYENYVFAVGLMQDYAFLNRQLMLELVIKAITPYMPEGYAVTDEAINCHHNYVEREHHFGENVWVTRKGAVRARKGDLGIIPGSMGAKSFIVRGLGNEDSFCSCSHGAGRVMSRGVAKEKISMEQHAAAMKGIEARLDSGVLDESPAAYKDIDAVMEAQKDLVEIVHTLKQVVNIKG